MHCPSPSALTICEPRSPFAPITRILLMVASAPSAAAKFSPHLAFRVGVEAMRVKSPRGDAICSPSISSPTAARRSAAPPFAAFEFLGISRLGVVEPDGIQPMTSSMPL